MSDSDDEIPITRGKSKGRMPPRSRPVGTAQQEDFWRVVEATPDHCRLTARAGTGKSFSAREGMHRAIEADPAVRCQCVAFNNAIATEFQTGLPRGAVASTMHAAGYRALLTHYPGIGEPDKGKPWRLAGDIIPGYGHGKKAARGAMVKLASLCKSHNLFNEADRHVADSDIIRLAATHGIVVPKDWEFQIFDGVTTMLNQTIEDLSSIDFDDMIFLPVMLGLDFDAADILFVDEAQDLSALQHEFVLRLAGGNRIMFIGDDRQAIYAFRGADSGSMDSLDAILSADPARDMYALPLTLTRRCPQSHVAIARGIVADFGCLPEAPEGEVITDADPMMIEPGWMVLCRTNAPLLAHAFGLAAAGTPVYIQGRDVGEQLGRLAEGLGARDAADLGTKARHHLARELRRLGDIEGAEDAAQALRDQVACLATAAVGCDTVAQVATRIRDIFIDANGKAASDYVLLSSVHKAKGREADRVAIIEPQLMPHKGARSAEARLQELNLGYVAVTRSKDVLAFMGDIPDIFYGGCE